MFYAPIDFEGTIIDGLVDTWALTSAISQSDLTNLQLNAHEANLDVGPPPSFQIMVANGQLENPISTVELKFMVADFIFHKRFIVMQTPPNPLIGLCFLHRYNAVFDIRQGVLTFPEMSMQLEPQNSFHLRAPL